METRPAPWIGALRHSHDRLVALVTPLGADEVVAPSYSSEWTIAQVMSHLGSQAEIFRLFLDAALEGSDPPGREAFEPIWSSWNAKSPDAQVTDGIRADEVTVERFESLDDAERDRLHLDLFGRDLDATGLARMRVSEHALHTWDIAVALDASATVADDAVALLVDTLGELVGRSAKAGGVERRVRVVTVDPARRFVLETGAAVTLLADESPDEPLPELRLPAEALVRLAYGRLDPDHTPASVETTGVDLDELRGVFPGF